MTPAGLAARADIRFDRVSPPKPSPPTCNALRRVIPAQLVDFSPNRTFNMDQLLHRGEFEVEKQAAKEEVEVKRGWAIFGMGKEFTLGDRIAILSPNTPALLEAHFAIPALGGILVPVNIRLQPDEVAHILADSGARFLFIDEALYPQIAELNLAQLQLIRIADTGQADDPYEQFLAAASPDPLLRVIDDANGQRRP